jgi:hypothetical protein
MRPQHPERPSRRTAAASIAFAAILVAGCDGPLEPDDPVIAAVTEETGRSEIGDDATAPVEDLDSTTETGSDIGGAADADGGASSDADDAGIDSGDAVGADAPDAEAAAETPDAPPVCGDGVRSLSEECDDGINTDAGLVVRTCGSDCVVRDVPVGRELDAGIAPRRTLGASRHPIAAGSKGFGVAFLDESGSTPRVKLALFSSKGVAVAPPVLASLGTTVAGTSAPAVGSLPDGRLVVAFTDIDGDSDGHGIALRAIDPAAPSLSTPLLRANARGAFAQYDVDLVWTGTELVVAWVDSASITTAPDLRFRRFDSKLTPLTSTDETLVTAIAAEADVALAPFKGSWAAAWRSASDGADTIRVATAGTTWSTPRLSAGPVGVRPALVELDTTHLLAVWVEMTSLGATKLSGAIVDIASTATLAPFSLAKTDVAPRDPTLARVGDRVFLGWRASSTTSGDDLFLQEIAWVSGALDTSRPSMPLPRWAAHRAGDQRRPALAAAGAGLVSAWEDLGGAVAGASTRDVIVQFAPTPILRSGGS